MNIRQSENYASYIRFLGWQVEKIGKVNVFLKKIGPTAVIKIQRVNNLDFTKVDQLAQKYHALFVKVEPNVNSRLPASPARLAADRAGGLIPNSQFQRDGWPLLPSKTVVIDLAKTDLTTLPKDTRYEIRKSSNFCLTVDESDDIDLFYQLLEETMKIGHWGVPFKKEVTSLYSAFQPNHSVILFVYPQNNNLAMKQFSNRQLPVAGCLLIWYQKTAHYVYAALNREGRSVGAAYYLLWQTVQFCQRKNLATLDLEGVYDDRYSRLTGRWKGFSLFKQSWGGRVVTYPGSFIKFYVPMIGSLFNLVDRIRG